MAEVNETPQTPQTRSGVTDTNELQSTLAGSGMTEPSDKRQSTRTQPEAAEDLKATAGAIAGKVEQTWDDARDRVRTFQEDSKQYVRENPSKAVFMALGIGFVLGLMFRR
jgi:ElaB/YqjD/DUF883 family membrane-anchored ribosome-binding protein